MSNPPADPAALPPPTESWLPGPKPPDEAWSRKKFFFVLLFVLAFHVALIVLFGTKKQIVPRSVSNVPHLELVNSANEIIELGNPTLFARPSAHDPATKFWRQIKPVAQPDFDWPAPPGYLPPAPENFGAVFHEFMLSSSPPEFSLNLKPEPKVVAPEVAFDNATPLATTMQISGDLARRRQFNTLELPSLLLNDVIKPSKVQVLVDSAGNVFSAVVLQSSGYNDADQRALQLVQHLRFAPAPSLTSGEITITWHTVPTNAIPASVP